MRLSLIVYVPTIVVDLAALDGVLAGGRRHDLVLELVGVEAELGGDQAGDLDVEAAVLAGGGVLEAEAGLVAAHAHDHLAALLHRGERGGALDGDAGGGGLRRSRALRTGTALPAAGGEGEGADEQPRRQGAQFHDRHLLFGERFSA